MLSACIQECAEVLVDVGAGCSVICPCLADLPSCVMQSAARIQSENPGSVESFEFKTPDVLTADDGDASNAKVLHASVMMAGIVILSLWGD